MPQGRADRRLGPARPGPPASGSAAPGDLVLLAPPHAESLRDRRSHPGRSRSGCSACWMRRARSAARRRAVIQAEMDRASWMAQLLALAPLFERHDPARVAGGAATGCGWRSRRTPGPDRGAGEAGAVERDAPRSGWASGKKDGASRPTSSAALTREIGIEPAKIGRIEIRELFSLVEVPARERRRRSRAALSRQDDPPAASVGGEEWISSRPRLASGSRGPSAPFPARKTGATEALMRHGPAGAGIARGARLALRASRSCRSRRSEPCGPAGAPRR